MVTKYCPSCYHPIRLTKEQQPSECPRCGYQFTDVPHQTTTARPLAEASPARAAPPRRRAERATAGSSQSNAGGIKCPDCQTPLYVKPNDKFGVCLICNSWVPLIAATSIEDEALKILRNAPSHPTRDAGQSEQSIPPTLELVEPSQTEGTQFVCPFCYVTRTVSMPAGPEIDFYCDFCNDHYPVNQELRGRFIACRACSKQSRVAQSLVCPMCLKRSKTLVNPDSLIQTCTLSEQPKVTPSPSYSSAITLPNERSSSVSGFGTLAGIIIAVIVSVGIEVSMKSFWSLLVAMPVAFLVGAITGAVQNGIEASRIRGGDHR